MSMKGYGNEGDLMSSSKLFFPAVLRVFTGKKTIHYSKKSGARSMVTILAKKNKKKDSESPGILTARLHHSQ